MKLSVIILAAGQGTRMKSQYPKVLHQLAGKSLLQWVVETAESLHPKCINVVYGFQGEPLKAAAKDLKVTWVYQAEQLGTAHAVLQALPHCDDASQVLILYADVPLITKASLEKLLNASQDTVGLITAEFNNPTGFGRIIRNEKKEAIAIVEQKDANPEELKIKEINTGILSARAQLLKEYLPKIKNRNTQKEFYLTDLIELIVKDGKTIVTTGVDTMKEVQGVNDRWQLAELERDHQLEQARQLCLQGVTLLDPHRFDLRGKLEAAQDVVIDVNVIIEGTVKIGARSKIGANVILKNVIMGEDVEILANSIVEGANIDHFAVIGPFARIRPGTKIAKRARIGNFVEVKNSVVGEHSKANHLSYLGDATIGAEVNIGAGTITCNYDGANKHPTHIGDRVFIGSNTSLIAPVRVKKEATIGAGSVITKDVPEGGLTLARSQQISHIDWQRPRKKFDKDDKK